MYYTKSESISNFLLIDDVCSQRAGVDKLMVNKQRLASFWYSKPTLRIFCYAMCRRGNTCQLILLPKEGPGH